MGRGEEEREAAEEEGRDEAVGVMEAAMGRLDWGRHLLYGPEAAAGVDASGWPAGVMRAARGPALRRGELWLAEAADARWLRERRGRGEEWVGEPGPDEDEREQRERTAAVLESMAQVRTGWRAA